MRVAIQGIPGSFAEKAAHAFFHPRVIECEYAITSVAACDALREGRATHAVVAIENSIGGRVQETDEAMALHHYTVVSRLTLPISQTLLARTACALNLLSEVHSHPQALAQSAAFLTAHCPQALRLPEADTALCAKRLSLGEWSDSVAVIASESCADLYGLTVLARAIQGEKNETQFLLLTYNIE